MNQFANKGARRRFFLERMRRGGRGTGSNIAQLMALPRRELGVSFDELVEGLRYAIVGGVATRLYQPERYTKDVDLLLDVEDVDAMAQRLLSRGAERTGTLAFPDSELALEGESWAVPGLGAVDLLWSEASWASGAIASARRDDAGAQVVSLAHLTLMKMDASRAIDQGDLARMLGLADDRSIAQTREVFAEHMPAAAGDLDSYIELGRLEMGGRGDREARDRDR